MKGPVKTVSGLWEGNLVERSLPWCRQLEGAHDLTGRTIWYHHLGRVPTETPSKNLRSEISHRW